MKTIRILGRKMKTIECFVSAGAVAKFARAWTLPVLGGWLFVSSVGAVDLFVSDGAKLERVDGAADTIKLRKLMVPNQGVKSGHFKWDPAQNAWVLNGNLAADGFYEWVMLLQYGAAPGIPTLIFELISMGPGIQAVSYTSPKGQVYHLVYDRTERGLEIYRVDMPLPFDQQTITDGEYVATYTLDTGATVSRTCYLNAAFPTAANITYPQHQATGIPLTPTLAWTAIGAARYGLYISDPQTGVTVYSADIHNTTETALTHAVPPGTLQPGRTYLMMMDAYSPMVNCGLKGISMPAVEFTTSP